MTSTAAGADNARDSEPLLSTYVDGDDLEPMSEQTLGHSRVMFRSGGNSVGDRGTTTPTALWVPPPPSRSPAGVPNSVSNSASITNHIDSQPRQHLSVHDNANRRRHRLALVWSYAPDWILCIGLSGCFSLLDYIHGFWREFDLTDTSIQHTFTVHERVPDWMLVVLAGFAPILLLPFINFCSIRSWWDLHIGWLGLLLSLTLTGVVTQATKVNVGRPRPDLIARCLPKQGSENIPVFGLVTAEICTQTDMFILKDGFRSFPSGHASLSFAGLGFLSFYLAGKIHLFDERGHTSKALVALTPLIGAALIAITRTMDYRHHWQDVTAGSFLGLGLAFFAYRQYYPPLSNPMSHRPYKPRTLRRQERNAAINAMGADPEGGRSAMTSEEDLRGHTQCHSQSWRGPSAIISSGTAALAPHTPHSVHTSTLRSHSKPVRPAEDAEVDERSEASGSVPDEERGINKPMPPKSIKEIWREGREREESP